MSWRPGYGIRRVGVDEVESVVEDPTVLIIDVREEDRDYGYGHIHGSWHYPHKTFMARDVMKELPPTVRRLIFHCAESKSRGPVCASMMDGALGESTQEAHQCCVVEILAGGFDSWYDNGYVCCKCEGQRCRKHAPVDEKGLLGSADLPPVLLLSDTHLLYGAIREERWEEATQGALSAGNRVEHHVIEELAKTARRARPDLQARKLRAAFIGALSGDAPMVEHAFFDLVKQMGLAEGRALRLFEKASLKPEDKEYLESADMVLIGGCVHMSPMLREAFPEAREAPIGPVAGLNAMHSAKLFDSLHMARRRGAICIGIVEGCLALGDGFVHDPTTAPRATAQADDNGDNDDDDNDDDDEIVQPCYFASRRPQAKAAAEGGSFGRGGGVVGGLLIGIGEEQSSKWPALCAALADVSAASAGAGGTLPLEAHRALGMPPKTGVLCYPDGSVSAIGQGKVTYLMWSRSSSGSNSDDAPPPTAEEVGAMTEAAAPAAAEPSPPVPTLLRTLLVPSVAPFEAHPAAGNKGSGGDYRAASKGSLWEGPTKTAALKLEQAFERLSRCKRIVAFTGAGISAESMIPTFRETVAANEPIDHEGVPLAATAIDKLTPLWTQIDPDKASHIETFHEDPAKWWEGEVQMVDAFRATKPNAAHKALADLHAAGILAGVVTQNIDGLHQAAGCKVVVELHGTMHKMQCAGVPRSSFTGAKGGMLSDADQFRQAMAGGPMDDRCGFTCPMNLDRVRKAADDESAPACPKCGGFLKTATVLFGEQLPEKAQDAAKKLMLSCDGLLIVGTSLNVYPAASYPELVRSPTTYSDPIGFGQLANSKYPEAKTHPRVKKALDNVDTSITGEGWKAVTRNPSPIVEVNAMHPTSPAAPDVMITGRAGEWLPKLAKRLIDEKLARDGPPKPPPPPPPPTKKYTMDARKGWIEIDEKELVARKAKEQAAAPAADDDDAVEAS